MKIKFSSLATAVVLLVAAITGCSPVYETKSVLHPPKTKQGKQCVNRCMLRKSKCQKSCAWRHEQCMHYQKVQAKHRYHRYVKQQREKGHRIKRSEKSFVDWQKCDTQCGCTKNYHKCYTLCGGAVTSKRVCTKHCS